MNVTAKLTQDSHYAEEYQVPITLLQPWSTPVMKTVLPPLILNEMLEVSDLAISRELQGATPWGNNLAGQIETEILIPLPSFEGRRALPFLERVLCEYVIRCKSQMAPVDSSDIRSHNWKALINRMWCVSQFPDEYNPVHVHAGCTVSAVTYLKVPDVLPGRKDNNQNIDGSINFISGASRDVLLSNPTLSMRPVVGDLYIFGANQLHAVYPFRCQSDQQETERRSVSFNAHVAIAE